MTEVDYLDGVDLYIFSFARSSALAQEVVEHILIQPAGSLPFSLREKANGQEWIRTTEGISQRIYSPPRLATSVPTRFGPFPRERLWSYWLGA